MPESRFVIVETFGTVVVLLIMHMSCTFVPTTVRASSLNQNRLVVMVHVGNSYFVAIKLSPGSPLPPTQQFTYFQKFYNINAEDWIKLYVYRVNKLLPSTEDRTEDVTLVKVE